MTHFFITQALRSAHNMTRVAVITTSLIAFIFSINTSRASEFDDVPRISSSKQKISALAPIHTSASISEINTVSAQNMYTYAYNDIYIYDAYVTLDEDLDYDGYNQTFTVSFDADIYASVDEHALIYAELFIREHGGVWEHYFSTEPFHIKGESTDDIFDVTTTLDSGFNPEYYDILIDVYEYGSDQLLTTYSADDNNALYALPLESSYYDTPIIIEDNHHYTTSYGTYGGSTPLLGVIAMFVFLFIRGRINKQ